MMYQDIELVIGSQKMDFTIPPRSTVTFCSHNSDEAFVKRSIKTYDENLSKSLI